MAGNGMSAANALMVCHRIVNAIEELADVQINTARVIQSRRTPPIALQTNESNYNADELRQTYHMLEKVLHNGIRFILAIYDIIAEFEEDLKRDAPGDEANDTYLEERDRKGFSEFWNSAQAVIESNRHKCLCLVRKVCELELEKSASHYAIWNLIEENNEKLELTAEDISKYINLHELHTIWRLWLKIAPLVLEHEPSDLPLENFLDTTDAIHFYYWTIFAKIPGQPLFGEHYMKLADHVISEGFPGPQYLLDLDDKGREHVKSTRVYKFAKQMLIDFTRPFFTAEFYERLIMNCLHKIVPVATKLYSEMRRSLCHYIAWFWGPERLELKMKAALDTPIGLTFNRCLDTIRNSRNLALDAKNKEGIDILLQSIVAHELTELCMDIVGRVEHFLTQRNNCLAHLVITHYTEVKNAIIVDLARFFINASKILERKGYTYYDLPLEIRLDLTNLVVCHRELVHICNRAIAFSCPEQDQIALVEWMHVAPQEFMDTEERVLEHLKHLPPRACRVTVNESFQNFFLTQDIRDTAQAISGIPAGRGKIAPSRDVSPYVPMEVRLLSSEPTNPADDALMEEHQFRNLLHRKIDFSQEINVGDIEFP